MRAIALDDEPLAVELLERFCSRVDFLKFEKGFTNTVKAIRYINEQQVDLLFLDINMPSLSGIQFYKSLAQKPLLIFTTSYSEFAVESYELNAVDFLLKPFSFERFFRAVEKANEYFSYLEGANASNATEQPLFVYSGYDLVKINLKDIILIQAMDDYVKIYADKQDPVLTRMTMKGILSKLPATEFLRVHKSFIIAVSRVEKLRNKMITIGTKAIPIGARYEKEVMSRFPSGK